MEQPYERGKCDICGYALADVVENSVKFCAKHYAAYKTLKLSEQDVRRSLRNAMSTRGE